MKCHLEAPSCAEFISRRFYLNWDLSQVGEFDSYLIKRQNRLNATFFEWSLALKLAEPETPVRVCHSLVPQADAS